MSDRPRVWTIKGLESLSQLRVFKENLGSLEELKGILKSKNKNRDIE